MAYFYSSSASSSSRVGQLQNYLAIYKHQIALVEARMKRKTDEHDLMLKQVKYSKEYAAIFDEQLERALQPMWDELIALGEKVERVGEELEKLKGGGSKESGKEAGGSKEGGKEAGGSKEGGKEAGGSEEDGKTEVEGSK